MKDKPDITAPLGEYLVCINDCDNNNGVIVPNPGVAVKISMEIEARTKAKLGTLPSDSSSNEVTSKINATTAMFISSATLEIEKMCEILNNKNALEFEVVFRNLEGEQTNKWSDQIEFSVRYRINAQ